MSRDLDIATDSLQATLAEVLRLRPTEEGEAIRLMDALIDFAREIARDTLDREFNRGDYRS